MIASIILAYTVSTPTLDSAKIDSLVKKAIDAGTPAISVAIAKGNKIVYAKVFNKAGNLPVSTPFRIGSITKQFTSVLITQLVREGKFNYEDTLGTLMPDTPAEWHAVTVRQLLTHTSGIPSYTDQQAFWTLMHKNQTPDGVWKYVRRIKPDFAPGKGWNYNNTGYCLLGCIIERKTGKPYFQVLNERIISPLGLKNTGKEKDFPVIDSFQMGDKKSLNISMDWPYAAGAIVSTAEDLAKWSIALRGTKVLSEAEKKISFAPDKVSAEKGSPYGFGWVPVIRNKKLAEIQHGGGINGFNSMLTYLFDPEVSIAVISNREDSSASELAGKIKFQFMELPNAIADTKPELTTKHREFFDKFLAGKVTDAEIGAEFKKVANAAQINAFGTQFAKNGSVTEFRLIKEGTSREYFVLVGEELARMSITLDAQNLLIGFYVRPY